MQNLQDVTTQWIELIHQVHGQDLASQVHLHRQIPATPTDTLGDILQIQHHYNCQLWAQEDIARSLSISVEKLAAVKRRIDTLNQQRNNWIEEINERFMQALIQMKIKPLQDARLNTETIGSVIDRLSILSQRIRALDKLSRDTNTEVSQPATEMLFTCQKQQKVLTNSLGELFIDVLLGKKIHYSFRMMKLYNDKRFNPFL